MSNPRPRKNKQDAWLPARVYRGRASFELHPSSGGSIRLGPLDAPKWEILKAYDEVIETLASKDTLSGLINEFFDSADFADLSPATQGDYKKYSRKIIAVFGKLRPDALEPQHLRRYMDQRGVKSRTQANREKAFLSRCYRWAYERGKVKRNPCMGVRAFKEVSRQRYIENWEYEAVYRNAQNHIRVAMEISYLCAARKGDVISMTWDQIREEGIYIQQGKTKVRQIKEWSPRLKAAVDLAKTLCKDNVFSRWVICQGTGKNFTPRGFDQGWIDARERARIETAAPLDFTFHDLKAKAVSDFEGSTKDKQNFTGHKTELQVSVYDRKVKVVPTIGSKKK